jgi:hypothetical protein
MWPATPAEPTRQHEGRELQAGRVVAERPHPVLIRADALQRMAEGGAHQRGEATYIATSRPRLSQSST